uniref:Uncharacterized protein n=1 Tax=Noccaea caerulescens TaxID=107243 RepID=A0A1J3DBJ3_NOCCA
MLKLQRGTTARTLVRDVSVVKTSSLWPNPNPNLDIENAGNKKKQLFLPQRVNSNDDVVRRMRGDYTSNQMSSGLTGRKTVNGIAVGVIQVKNVDDWEFVYSAGESCPRFLCCIPFPPEVSRVEKTSGT